MEKALGILNKNLLKLNKDVDSEILKTPCTNLSL